MNTQPVASAPSRLALVLEGALSSVRFNWETYRTYKSLFRSKAGKLPYERMMAEFQACGLTQTNEFKERQKEDLADYNRRKALSRQYFREHVKENPERYHVHKERVRARARAARAPTH